MFDWLRRRRPSESADKWLGVRSHDDGKPLLVRMRSAAPTTATADFPYLISILWTYDGSSQGGLPDEDTLDKMNACEASLDAIDGSDLGHFMVCTTGNNRREWLWYVRDKVKYMEAVNQLLSQNSKYPIDLEASDDPTWRLYDSIRSKVK